MSKRRPAGKRRGSPGFTLIEMIVASVLSSVVLMGMFSIMSNMVSAEIDGMRNGTVSGWSLAGINTMNADIAGSGAIGYPASGGLADSLIVCTNWSNYTGGAVQPGAGNDVYYYCWDTADAAPLANSFLRMKIHHNGGSETCPAAPPACNQAAYSAGAYGSDTLVATGVYRDAANDNVFYTDNKTLNAVRIRYVVGNPNAGAVSAGSNGGTVSQVPVSIPFNTEIILED